MINTEFFVDQNGGLRGFRVAGHSGFAKAGEDIVCSAVSSAAYMTANTVTEILGVSASVFDADGEMVVRISSNDVFTCRDIFEGFKLHMIGLEEQYYKNINVNYTEV